MKRHALYLGIPLWLRGDFNGEILGISLLNLLIYHKYIIIK